MAALRLRCSAWASRCRVFSCCRAGSGALGLWSTGSIVVATGLVAPWHVATSRTCVPCIARRTLNHNRQEAWAWSILAAHTHHTYTNLPHELAQTAPFLSPAMRPSVCAVREAPSSVPQCPWAKIQALLLLILFPRNVCNIWKRFGMSQLGKRHLVGSSGIQCAEARHATQQPLVHRADPTENSWPQRSVAARLENLP